MLHEARDRQKFVSDVQYLRDMQHKADSEYQACLRRQEYRRDPNEKKQDQFGGQETNLERPRFSTGSSSKQSSGEEDSVAEPRLSTKSSAVKGDSRLPAIDQTSVKQKHKSTMTPRKPEKVGPSKPSSGDSSEHPLFCVEYSPYCSVFAFSPFPQPNTNSCCLLLPLLPPASPVAQDPFPQLPPAPSPSFTNPSSLSPGPVPQSPATLCYFPVSCPTPAETPVLCLPRPRRPSKIYLVWLVKLCLITTLHPLKNMSSSSGELPPLLCGHTRNPSRPHQLTLPAQAPQILSRKRRPNLGRLTVSPETQSPRVPGDRSRQKSQLPVKSPALRGPDPIVQQEGPVWASGTKLKRPTQERRHLVPSSQLMAMTENTPERAKKGDSSVLSQNEPHSGLSQAFLGTNSPQVSSESLGPPLLTTTMGGSRRAPFRFRDEDFYSILSLNPGGENDDTEEETLIEEELLLVGMHRPRSPSSHKRSRFLGTSATQAKSKNFEESPENCRANSVRRTESSRGSLRMSNAMEPVTEQLPVGARVSQDLKPPGGGSPNENDSGDSEHEKSTFPSWDTKSTASLDDDLSAENGFRDCTSTEDRPGIRDYERDWHGYLSSSSNSLDCFLSGRPTAPRSPVSLSYNTPGSLMHSAMRDDIPVDLSMSSTFIHSSDSEGNSRFNVRRPLSPIRNRNPLTGAENHGYFPVNSAHEFDVRGAEDIPLTNTSQGALEYTEELLLNPQSNLSLGESSSSSPSRMNLQGHLHVPGSLQENMPFTFFAVSNFPNQSDNGNRMAASAFTDEKEANKIKADSEKLKKLQESLLEEDSEEEGDLCRICQIAGGSPTNPLLEPCGCVGSLRFVHQECLKKWLKVKITSGADLGAAKTCEMCKQGLLVDLDDFNVTDFYHKHQQSRAQNELMNSGLYLALLLHLYEQRFAELMRRNYNRVIRERLSRNYPQPRPEENENSELGDGNESNGHVV